jgi:hypothetical protein
MVEFSAPILMATALQITAPAPAPPQPFTFATIEKAGSGGDVRVRISTLPGLKWNDRRNSYRFDYELEEADQEAVKKLVADSRTCPVAAPIVRKLQSLRMTPPYVPPPPAPDGKTDYSINVINSAGYHLEVTSKFESGLLGQYSIDSDYESPLAEWVDSLLKVLRPCLSPGPVK